MTRAKMFLQSMEDSYNGGKKVLFNCMYDENTPEDQRFAKSTPSGHMELDVDNPKALEQLEQDKYYYVDILPVE